MKNSYIRTILSFLHKHPIISNISFSTSRVKNAELATFRRKNYALNQGVHSLHCISPLHREHATTTRTSLIPSRCYVELFLRDPSAGGKEGASVQKHKNVNISAPAHTQSASSFCASSASSRSPSSTTSSHRTPIAVAPWPCPCPCSATS